MIERYVFLRLVRFIDPVGRIDLINYGLKICAGSSLLHKIEDIKRVFSSLCRVQIFFPGHCIEHLGIDAAFCMGSSYDQAFIGTLLHHMEVRSCVGVRVEQPAEPDIACKKEQQDHGSEETFKIAHR